MKDQIKYIHHREYIHMKCCYYDLYDVKLRIEFLDMLEIMKKYPMTHQPSIFQKLSFFIHNIDIFIYEIDLEILRKAFDSLRIAHSKLIELNANDDLISDYSSILNKLQDLLIKYGHLD